MLGTKNFPSKKKKKKSFCASKRRYIYLLQVCILNFRCENFFNHCLGRETTYITGRSTASAIVATSETAPISSITAPFYRNSIWSSHIGCFCTLRKKTKTASKLKRAELIPPSKETALDSQNVKDWQNVLTFPIAISKTHPGINKVSKMLGVLNKRPFLCSHNLNFSFLFGYTKYKSRMYLFKNINW